jgi:hypothetical protein
MDRATIRRYESGCDCRPRGLPNRRSGLSIFQEGPMLRTRFPSAFSLLAMVLMLASPAALAQRPPAPGQPAAPGGRGAPPATGECLLLTGQAPVGRIADLQSRLEPRALSLSYFGKTLADLTPADYAMIGELSGRCPGTGAIPADKMANFIAVIEEAQGARAATLTRLGKTRDEIAKMPVGRDKLMRLNELAGSLDDFEAQLTRGDLALVANWIQRQMQMIYDAAPKGRLPDPAQVGASLPPASEAAARAAAAGRRRAPGGEEE